MLTCGMGFADERFGFMRGVVVYCLLGLVRLIVLVCTVLLFCFYLGVGSLVVYLW